MKRVITLVLAIVAAASLLLCGCSPIENRLDKRLIVQGIGIDKDKDEYKVTVMYMDTANPVGEGDVTSSFANGSGTSVLAALTDTANKVGREPLYGQCSFIILGEELTKDGIKETLDFFVDYYEFHPNINVFCADREAEKIMKSENMNDRLMQDFSDTETTTGKTISSTLTEVYSDLIGGKASAVTALVGLENNSTVLKGAAAFKQDRLGAVLNSEQCMAVLLLCGRAKSVWDIFPSGESEKINYSLSDCNSKVKVSRGGGIEFDISITSHARAYGLSGDDKKTESKIELRIKSLCENAIRELLKEKQIDVFNLERELYNQNYDRYKELKDAKQAVLLSKISVQVDIDLQK